MTVQPATVAPMKWEIKAYSRPAMLAREMKIPKLEMIFSGRTLKEVMPSTAKCSIFFSGYLDSPAKRSCRS